ncbi:MAG: thioredoxin domain-containing protein [Gammaproteobacteria bacterium]|nr:thioredoxin domain-containing protein [Gammaproteobacteria bacterium]NNF60736.1 thioredoxin domain-containing protein [Gammaproteobacteria bacterium]
MPANPNNRLAGETSPYLQQHADNPVDWHPWDDTAFATARAAGKPVLLSIGYSACHWCHVMAHESFENDEIAAVMNELFVNVKVDREERPDLDQLYQTAHQLLAQRPGGWPLTVFIDPDDKLPFFAGTYFPPQPRQGMPGFPELLRKAAGFYRDHSIEIGQQKSSMADAFKQIDNTDATTGQLDDTPLTAARRELEQAFDPHNGGFGDAPKFPQPTSIERLLQHWSTTRDDDQPDVRALHMAVFTLEQMARGGIYDQLGGGFYRYSVDAKWRIPHFEKMLYDNGLLLALCARAWQATGQPLFQRTARETADWVLRDMRSDNGGFYATLDADSEGEEGRYYVWQGDEARQIVGNDDWPDVAAHFGLDDEPNFEGQHHLWQAQAVEEADREGIDRARAALLAAREQRVRPDRDEKILTGCNALMIRGLAIAARSLDEPAYADAATSAVDFIRRELWRDGRLLASWKDETANLPAYLDDHAFLIDALLELLQYRWRSEDLNFALALAELLLTHFEDGERGGFFFTADDHEALFHRARPLNDQATPAGNGVAARGLLRLGYLVGETRYLEAAERTLRAGWDLMRHHPQAHASLVNALAGFLQPPEILVLRGSAEKLDHWQQQLRSDYRPDRLCYAIPADAKNLPDGLALREPRGEIFAYLCRGHTCTAGAGLDELLRNQNR